MQLGIAYDPDYFGRLAPATFLATVAKWGVQAVEIYPNPYAADWAERLNLARLCWDAGLIVHCHTPTPRYAPSSLAFFATTERAALCEFYERIFAYAAWLTDTQGSRSVVVIHGPDYVEADILSPIASMRLVTLDFLTWAAETLDRHEWQTCLGFEVLLASEAVRALGLPFQKRVVGDSRAEVLDLVKAVGNQKIGITWDLLVDWANAFHAGHHSTPEKDFLKHVVHAHLHDTSRNGAGVHYTIRPGQLNYHSRVRALLAAGYQGTLTLEIFARYTIRSYTPIDSLQIGVETVLQALEE
ncbi:MAG: sugar phosphate isomerase/epimerase [Chloroflexi bacterium]|nr:sugar phosphate isomerase/epimerase [Chloroflexota bacterium]